MGKTRKPHSQRSSKKKRALKASRAAFRATRTIIMDDGDNVSSSLQNTNVDLSKSQSPTQNSPPYEIQKDSTSQVQRILTGRRIVDIGYIMKQLIEHKHVALYNCNITNLQFVKEDRSGFSSMFLFECSLCRSQLQLHSDDPLIKPDVNMAAVSGAIMSGNGFKQLDEIIASLNIPPKHKRQYYQCQEKIHTVIGECAWDEIEKAGKEEVALALEHGDVDEQGTPLLTVIADGAWSKRSYKTNYNASSGVVSNKVFASLMQHFNLFYKFFRLA
ncbi:uncharacterized protein [Onthophagus taurus]|uniref:uncharacterized protein n=1 Tax=Onthophagus taurus TaxID=166361 RepID=UPI0039BE9C60